MAEIYLRDILRLNENHMRPITEPSHRFARLEHRSGRVRGLHRCHAMAGVPSGGRGGQGHMGHGGSRDGGGHGHGRGRGGRMFEHGAIKLLALSLVAERPSYGYELIKHIEGLVGGEYSPSPGVIYPTLTYLVDMGWATVSEADAGRKQYTVTAAGLEQLERQRAELTALTERLQVVRTGAQSRRSPEVERAMGNLKAVLHTRLSGADDDGARARRVAALIDEAALAIQRLEN